MQSYIYDLEESDLVSMQYQELIKRCQNYINDNCQNNVRHWFFGNPQTLQAKHVIDQLQFLVNNNILTPGHQLLFKQVVLKSYIIALQEYLPKNSRLLVSVNEFVNKFFPNQNFDDIKQNYKDEIDQAKSYFSSFIFRQCAYQYNMKNGVSVFYDVYKKLHPDAKLYPRYGEGIELKRK